MFTVTNKMSDADIAARAAAFRASIASSRVTLAKVESTLARWVVSGMAQQADVDAILAIVRAS